MEGGAEHGRSSEQAAAEPLLQAVKGHLEELLPALTMMASGAVGKMLLAVRQDGGPLQVKLQVFFW